MCAAHPPPTGGSARERTRLKIKSLPANLAEAIDHLEKDKVLKEALGTHIFDHFIVAKRQEWADYIAHVHPWELDRYLSVY